MLLGVATKKSRSPFTTASHPSGWFSAAFYHLHKIYCRQFLKMAVKDRRRAVVRHKYCLNCLARSHKTAQCTSTNLCQRCERGHHTLLHEPIQQRLQPERCRADRRRVLKNKCQRPTTQLRPAERGGHNSANSRLRYGNNSNSEKSQRCLEKAFRILNQLKRAL
ncbi:uncharacterized protein LOC131995696 isoform X2 [Stomoxys calcitrans]|uniref:uncharacterized protein LOC131995538 isoform X2 n=1 Tax=Stomoxys calcitrans TaxID=35570 RepID=UPI0027E252D9|nr:uncharacterized protein LOC131995538 isoform X2 [Stomoxys calcitrans]XP_059220571.1 uncharacterized protein LOC131995696 isoform X2 [Stomoxys calcitrans]